MRPPIRIHLQHAVPENEAFKPSSRRCSNRTRRDFFIRGEAALSESRSKAGVLGPIDAKRTDDVKDHIGAAGVGAFSRGQQALRPAQNVPEGGVLVQQAAARQGGCRPRYDESWDGYSHGVKKLQGMPESRDALVDKDKWPTACLLGFTGGFRLGPARMSSTRPRREGAFAAIGIARRARSCRIGAAAAFQEGFEAAPTAILGYSVTERPPLHLMGDWTYRRPEGDIRPRRSAPGCRFGSCSSGLCRRKGTPTTCGRHQWRDLPKNARPGGKVMDGHTQGALEVRQVATYIQIVAGEPTLCQPVQQAVAKNLGKAHWCRSSATSNGAGSGRCGQRISAALASNATTAESRRPDEAAVADNSNPPEGLRRTAPCCRPP